MYKVTIYSERIYEDSDKISNADIDNICKTIKTYCRTKYAIYNLSLLKITDNAKYLNILNGSSLHVYTKLRYGLNDYYANSIVRNVEGLIKSCRSNKDNYIEQYKEQLKDVKNNLKCTEKDFDKYVDFRQAFILARTFIRNNSDDKTNKKLIKELNKHFKHIKLTDSEIVVSKPFSQDKTIYGFYEFEYKYLNHKIKELRNKVGKYKYRINNLTNKIENLKKHKRCIFGSKQLMKKYTRNNCTKQDLYDAKYKEFEVSGRDNSKHGNFTFKATYNTDTKDFNFIINLLHNKVLNLHNIKFPYRYQELADILKYDLNTNHKKKRTVSYSIIRKKDCNNKYYFQIKAVFDIDYDKRYINYDKSTGIIAIDFNYGHLDMTELDAKGNLINSKTIYYSLDFNSHQNEISLRKAIDEIAEYANKQHKCIVVEDINTYKASQKANKDKHKQKILNYTLHRLPYEKYLQIMDYAGVKHSTDVIKVKPNFTSIIGKLKYSNNMKLNTHISASYVIGRRAMGFKEKPLSSQNVLLTNIINKSEWAKWSYLNKALK